jgi:hypothetical protein
MVLGDHTVSRFRISRLGRLVSGGLVAILAGLGTVALANATSIVSRGSDFLSETWPVLTIHVALAALPFLVLAMMSDPGRAAWLTTGVLTAIVWTLPALDQMLREGEGGANIGLGIFMLVSPVLILGGALAAKAATRRSRMR